MLGLHHYLAAVRRRRELEVDALRRYLVDRYLLHPLQHLHAALHLACLGGLVAEALDERLYLRHLPLLVGQLRHLARPSLLHLHHILRVGTLVVIDAAGGDLDGARGDVVEEGAVMAHEHHGATV